MNQPRAASCELPAAGFEPRATSHEQRPTRRELPVTSQQRSEAIHLSRATHHASPATDSDSRVSSHESRVWYREPWPWLLMAGPAAAIVAGAVTVWLAVASADGVVADDYYKRGLAINRDIDRDRAAAVRGISADLTAQGRQLHVRLGGNSTPEVVFAQFTHATRAGLDQRVRLTRTASGTYETALPELAPGRWRVIVEDPRGEWRIVKEWP